MKGKARSKAYHKKNILKDGKHMKLTLLGIDIKKNQRSFINLLERYGVNRRTRCFCEIHQCCKVMTFWFAGYLSIFCEFLVVDHGTFLLPICQTSLSNRIRKKKAKQLPIMLKRNLKKRTNSETHSQQFVEDKA